MHMLKRCFHERERERERRREREIERETHHSRNWLQRSDKPCWLPDSEDSYGDVRIDA